MPIGENRFWQLGIAIVLGMSGAIAFSGSTGNPAIAQISPDTTLGTENSVITPNVEVKGFPADLIEGGAVRGANLFHSFSEFNIGEGLRVYFANPAGIENILTRVTGNNLSIILGTLGVDGEANLFLLNPNGIIFGEKTKLDIAGSFVASTANSLVFENSFAFSATNPEAPPLLTINVPLGLQHGSNQPAATITNTGNLVVGQNLTLSASHLNLQGQLLAGGNLTLQALDTVLVRDRVANPFTASAGGQLVVQGNLGVDIFALNHPESGFFSTGDMVLLSANTVRGDAHYTTGGSFRIEHLDGSLGKLSSPYDPVILADGDVFLDSYTGGSLHILAGGAVEILGTVEITSDPPGDTISENVILSDGTTVVPIDGSSYPTLDIRAGIDWTLLGGLPGDIDTDGIEPSFGTSATSADITIGDVLIFAPDGLVLITNQYRPNTALLGGQIQAGLIDTSATTENGGNVFIDSRGGITLTDDVNSGSTAASGNGGKVTLIANGDITTSNIDSSSSFLDGGQITLTSRNGAIDTSAGSLISYADFTGRDGGQISLSATGDITVGYVDSSGGELGAGGNITLTTYGKVSSNDGLLSSDTYGPGNSGDIVVTARSVSFTNGAQLSTSTSGQGNAGNIIIQATDTVSFEGVSRDGFSSAAFSTVEAGAVGDGGDIDINTGSLAVTNGAQLIASTSGQGNAGNITIQATDTVSFDESDAFSDVESGAVGDGGDIDINTGSLAVTNGAQLIASTGGQGNAGNITIQVTDSISLEGVSSDEYLSGVFSDVEAGAEGNGGDINISTGSLSVADGAMLQASTSGLGNAGNITIQATDTVSFDRENSITGAGASSEVFSGAVGNGGNLKIISRSLSVSNGAFLTASTRGQGNTGSITIQATDSVSFEGVDSNGNSAAAGIEVQPGGVGNGGTINISTSSLSVANGAQLRAFTRGQGNAGNINLTATDAVSFEGVGSNGLSSAAFSSVEAGAVGDGGNIDITAHSLSVTGGAQLLALTRGQGNAGNVNLTATDAVSFEGVGSNGLSSAAFSSVGAGAVGDGGDLKINTHFLSVTNGAVLSTSTRGQGNAGNVNLTATDTVSFERGSAFSTVEAGAVGDGGDIDITTRSLSVTGGAQLQALTRGQGNAGNVTLTATDTVSFDGVGSSNRASSSSGAYSGVEAGAVGDGGNLDITTDSLSITGGAQLSVRTRGQGNAGNVTITATDSVSFEGVGSNGQSSAAFSSVEAGAVGDGGNLDITTDSLSITGGAQLSASSFGQGNAGDIIVTANTLEAIKGGQLLTATASSEDAGNITLMVKDDVNLSGSGSGLFANTNRGSTGNGGSIFLNSRTVRVQDGAGIAVDSQGTGQGGDIEIQSNFVTLDNQAFISAKTASNTGGDINLRVQDLLLLRRESGISTTAGTAQAGGDGGDITIGAQFIVGVPSENSDITANAFQGRGGNINITTQGIFGLEYRPRLTPVSDINASSEFGIDGSVQINTPGIDPSRGLTQLPTDLVDAAGLVDRSCTSGGGVAQRSRFTVTGRGGLPPNPVEALNSDTVWTDLRPLIESTEKTSRSTVGTQPNQDAVTSYSSGLIHPDSPPTQIVEAQGWIIARDGTVILTAQVPTVTPQSPWQTSLFCQSQT